MNQRDINKIVDQLLKNVESDIEEVFAKRLKSILQQMSEMYRKFGKGKEPSWTDVNKYNRFQQEMARIAEQLDGDYRKIIKEINKAHQTMYVEKYLLMAYLFSQASGEEMGFRIPSQAAIEAALINPVEFLTLPKIFEAHRDEIIRRLNIEIAQSIQIGESYTEMAHRLENAMGWTKKKAILVARTEGGRVRSKVDLAVEEQASKTARLTKVWMSSLDTRVRMSHRKLDGQKADKDGYFHYGKWKAKGPRLWNVASMDIQCRCSTIYMVNGKLPEYRRGRDYMDDGYQKKLADKIDKFMADEGLTYIQAFNKAYKQVKPPSVTIPFVSYPEWKKKFSGEGQ